MTEHTEAQLVKEVAREITDQIYPHNVSGRAAGAAKAVIPLIQAQVLLDMYESTKTDYLISPSPRPADFVKKHAKETYGIEL